MYTNADVTLYLYSKEGKTEKYTRFAVKEVYWEYVRQSTFLKTGQRESTAVMLVVPLDSLTGPMRFTPGKDLVVKGIIADEIDSGSEAALSKSLSALRSAHGFMTVTTADERLYGGESMQHYELACK